MNPPFVLVIHEQSDIQDRLEEALIAQGYTCLAVTTGRAAFDAVEVRRPDTVLLSLDLPRSRTIELCRVLRARTRVPIIVLSSNHTEERKIEALDAGADDFLAAPFSMPELLARLRVAIRHRRALAASIDDSVLHIDSLRIDPSGHAATLDNRILSLTPKEFELLVLLARNAGRVVAHQAILDAIWPNGKSFDTLRLHVSQLRRKIGSAEVGPSLITLPGVGYMLAPGAGESADSSGRSRRSSTSSG